MRTPATPRSNQNLRMSSCSLRTSGWFQLRSGCSGVKRWRYHCPGVPSGFVVRVQVSPAKGDTQWLGISSPSTNQKRSRSGEPGPGGERRLEPLVLVGDVVRNDVDDRADSERKGFLHEQLGLGERSEVGVDRPVVAHVVAAVGERGRVEGGEPDGVDAEVAQVPEPRAHAGQVAGAVAVAVREAAHVDLVDDGRAPPERVGGGGAERSGLANGSARGRRRGVGRGGGEDVCVHSGFPLLCPSERHGRRRQQQCSFLDRLMQELNRTKESCADLR